MLSRLAVVSLLVAVSSPVLAQEACKPEYKVTYKSCVTEKSPVHVTTVTTDWILVNEGARRITDGICIDHIGVIAQQNPKASNIRFKEIDDRDATFRGLGKRDVYCKFDMDMPVQAPIQSEVCGVGNITREGCLKDLTIEFTNGCLNMQQNNEGEAWKRAACLIDSFQQAPKIQGMDSATYENVKFQLKMMMEAYAVSPNASERNLSGFIRQQLNPDLGLKILQ